MKKKSGKRRNAVAVAMNKRCKGGFHKSKLKKRNNGRNKQSDFLLDLNDI